MSGSISTCPAVINAILAAAGKGLETAGADLLLVSTNTMQKIADRIQAAVGVPMLHIEAAVDRALGG